MSAQGSLLKTAAPELKKELGRSINELKRIVEDALAEREAELAASARPAHAVDITLPGRVPQLGYRHPLSLIRDEVIEIFTRLGYSDCQYLAPRIKAEILMGVGLMDTICPPSSQFAAYNKITSKKNVAIFPDFGHEGLPGFGDQVYQFMGGL